MNIKGASGEVSKGKEEFAFGNWRKGNSCYKASKSLAEMCPRVLVEFASDELEHLAEISKQCWRGCLVSPCCL